MQLPKLLQSKHIVRLPEHQLIAAILNRGVADYIMLTMIDNHPVSVSYHRNDLIDSKKWISLTKEELSAANCCQILELPWDGFLHYIAYIDSIKKELSALRYELNKFN